MKKVLRVGFHTSYSDLEFEEHIALVKRNVDVIDEVVLFTEPMHHGYRSIEKVTQTC